MPTNTLTDARCRAAKPGDKAIKLFDGGGLHLWISPKGAKVWRLAYRLAGKPKTLSIGPYPEVSLAEARLKRDQHRATLRDGDDPMAPRLATRKGITLDDASEQYWGGRHDLSESYVVNAQRGIAMHLSPALGKRNIGSITRGDLLDALRAMDAKGLHVYVRKVRMWVGQVFEWAVQHEYADINPAALIRPEKAFGRAPVEHHAAVELRDVPGLIQRINMERDIQSVLAVRLLAYTWTRTGELRMMEWAEIDGDQWIIPAGKMKRRLDHLVPLSRQALAVIEGMRARARPGSPYVFPSDRRADRPMSDNAILYLLHRIGYKGRMTGHGWRSVASTWANEKGYSPDAIERQLAHVPANEVRAAYNRAQYLQERQTMLQAWADWLDAQAVTRG
ncbi:tyrosine-type recombinase/integrase [Thauera butanivorans]|uniref:tyrosine-type recombinase/integrase n=1 Tax=Thauera butanivorans TaxID=86174 RepID=UPI0008389ED7|nr:integrase arm-type DNA-binding domain-containing protein [Thauera butanivorans]